MFGMSVNQIRDTNVRLPSPATFVGGPNERERSFGSERFTNGSVRFASGRFRRATRPVYKTRSAEIVFSHPRTRGRTYR